MIKPLESVIRIGAVIFVMAFANVALPVTFADPTQGQKSLAQRASFDELQSRYPSPFAVFQQFQRIAPVTSHYYLPQCKEINQESAPVIGTIDPLQGASSEQEPGPLFYQYYQTCVKGMVDDALNDEHAHASGEIIFGPNLLEQLQEAPTSYGGLWPGKPWNKLKKKLRSETISRMLLYLVGPPSMLRDLSYIGNPSAFGQNIQDLASLVEFLDHYLLSPEKNFTVRSAYAELAIILRLGPALRS